LYFDGAAGELPPHAASTVTHKIKTERTINTVRARAYLEIGPMRSVMIKPSVCQLYASMNTFDTVWFGRPPKVQIERLHTKIGCVSIWRYSDYRLDRKGMSMQFSFFSRAFSFSTFFGIYVLSERPLRAASRKESAPQGTFVG